MDTVWVPLVKFIHVLTAAGLLGAIIMAFAHGGPGKSVPSPSWSMLRKGLIMTTLLAGITGLLLVYPRHFTFHTAWVRAAILGVLALITLLFIFFPGSASLSRHRRHTRLPCLVMIVLLVMIIHDAVTKQTLLSYFHT